MQAGGAKQEDREVKRPPAFDAARAVIVDDVHAEFFDHLAGVPGLEVHSDPDVTWKVSPASAWSNCGVRPRFDERNARARLDAILERYRRNGRGAGFWVGPGAEPATLEALLGALSLDCRKYYPAMYLDLGKPLPDLAPAVGIEFSALTDYSVFREHEHPSLGRITTAIRRFGLATERHLAARSPRRSWDFLASLNGLPAGICTLFLGSRHAGLFDVGVRERLRNRGIGRALVRHACAFACAQGMEGVVLIATNLGYRVYTQVGFEEVARFGFWYSAHP